MSERSRARATAKLATSAKAPATSGAWPASWPTAVFIRWGPFIAGGFIVLAALAAYGNSFSGPFVYDDPDSILKNPTIRHLWPAWQVLSPPPGETVGGRPLLNLTFALNYAISGTAAWSYHALNLLIHILAGLTLFGLVRRTLLRLELSHCGRPPTAASATVLAFFVAIIWVVHPLQTESVTYISQRAESLMGLFYLLTLYCFVRSTDETGERQQARGERPEKKTRDTEVIRPPASGLWPLASCLFCFLGMATKEVMVSAPLMVLLYDRTFVTGTFRAAWQKRRGFYLGLACTWLLLGYLIVTLGGRGDTAGFSSRISAWNYALTQFHAIAHYLRLSVWPQPLILDYGRPVLQQVAEAAPYAVIIVPLAALTAIGLWRNHALGFLGAWFFAILAPSSSVVPVVTETMAEHRMYLPLASVIVVLVVGLYALLGWRSLVICLALSVGLGVLTARRNEDYRSELAIWSDNVAKCPDNPFAHLNKGRALLAIGSFAEAREQFEISLRLKPDLAEAWNNLGLLLDQQGRTAEAIEDYQQSLRLATNFVVVHYNLAVDLQQMGRLDEAVNQYREVVQKTPDDSMAQCGLGSALAQMGSLSEAEEHLQQAARLDPNYADAHSKLANVLILQGRLPEALAQFEETVRISPEFAEAHYNLGNALVQSGRLPEAVDQYELALRLKPDFAAARHNLELARNAVTQPANK